MESVPIKRIKIEEPGEIVEWVYFPVKMTDYAIFHYSNTFKKVKMLKSFRQAACSRTARSLITAGVQGALRWRRELLNRVFFHFRALQKLFKT